MNILNLLSVSLRAALLMVLVACGQKDLSSFQSAAEILSVEEAKAQAISWMNEAEFSSELSTAERKLASRIKGFVLNNEILPSPSILASECEQQTGTFVAAFVVQSHSNAIFVCQKAMNYGPEFLAQVLVHESIHLAGILDECRTTELERKIILAAGGSPIDNAYVSACGLSSLN